MRTRNGLQHRRSRRPHKHSALRAPIVCVGDLMREAIRPLKELPSKNCTAVLDWSKTTVGGAAFNLSWYLRQLGMSPRLVSICGAGDQSLIRQDFGAAGISCTTLITVPENND